MSEPNPQSSAMDSRKFRAVVMAVVVFSIPLVFTFVLVLAHQATMQDLKDITKWMGLGLSPILTGYIFAVAIEDFAAKRGPTVMPQQTTGTIVNELTPGGVPATEPATPRARSNFPPR